jgi:hypothetical protein
MVAKTAKANPKQAFPPKIKNTPAGKTSKPQNLKT